VSEDPPSDQEGSGGPNWVSGQPPSDQGGSGLVTPLPVTTPSILRNTKVRCRFGGPNSVGDRSGSDHLTPRLSPSDNSDTATEPKCGGNALGVTKQKAGAGEFFFSMPNTPMEKPWGKGQWLG